MASFSYRAGAAAPLGALARLCAILLFALTCVFAIGQARAADDYLDPDAAFKFSARMVDPQTIAVTYEIAEGYYMYRERYKFTAAGAKLGAPQIPPGKVKFDETFQKNVETYRHNVTITIPVEANGMFTLTASGQGCADAGLCYAPQETQVRLVGATTPGKAPAGAAASTAAPAGVASPASVPAASAAATAQPSVTAPTIPNATGNAATAQTLSAVGAGMPGAPAMAQSSGGAAAGDQAQNGSLFGGVAALSSGKLWVIIPAFILLGLALSYTPCVLPMVPILSSIIVGEGAQVTRARAFSLSLIYSLGVAIVYTVLGVTAALLGEGLAAALQNPWVLGAFGALIVAMAMSMFGFYELQLPGALQTRLANMSGRQSSGKALGVFVMGAISALILGPCVTAPLTGALLFIGKTRDILLGGSALFSLAIGMCIPLLLVGASAGSLLPRAGAWMDSVKRFFGVLLLAMALWLVSPVIPPVIQMLGWTALGLGYGFFLLRHTKHWAAMALGAACAVLGAVQLVGVSTGGRDALAPLAHLSSAPQYGIHFQRIKTIAELDAMLAKTGGKTAILDFYADWCVSCKEMEKLTFVNPAVKAQLANSVLLQVDVTANDGDDKAMLKRFHLFGPPGIILFDHHGQEIPDSRIIGYQDAEKFLGSVSKLQ